MTAEELEGVHDEVVVHITQITKDINKIKDILYQGDFNTEFPSQVISILSKFRNQLYSEIEELKLASLTNSK